MRRLIYIKPQRAPRLNKTAELDYGFEFLNRRVLSVKLIQKFIDSEALTESEISVIQGVVYSAIDDLEADFSQLGVACYRSQLLGVCTRVYAMALLTFKEVAAVLEAPDNLKRTELTRKLSAVLGYILKVALGASFWKVQGFRRSSQKDAKTSFNYRRRTARRKLAPASWYGSRVVALPTARLAPGRIRKTLSQLNSSSGFEFRRNAGFDNIWLVVFNKSGPANNFLNKGAIVSKRTKRAVGGRVPPHSALAAHWTARQYLDANGSNTLSFDFVNTKNSRPSANVVASPALRSKGLTPSTAIGGLRLAVRSRKNFTRPWRFSNFKARRFLGRVRLLNIKHNTKIRKKTAKLRKRRSKSLLRFEQAMSEFFNRGVWKLTSRVFGNARALMGRRQPLLLGKRRSALGFRWKFTNGIFRLAFRQKKKHRLRRRVKMRQALIRRNTNRFYRIPAKLKAARASLRRYLPIFGRFSRLKTKKVARVVTSKLFLRDIFWKTNKPRRKFVYCRSPLRLNKRLFGHASALRNTPGPSFRTFVTSAGPAESARPRLVLFKPQLSIASVLNKNSEFRAPVAFYKHIIKQRLLRRWRSARGQGAAPTNLHGHASISVGWTGAHRTLHLPTPTLELRTGAAAGLTLTNESSPLLLPPSSVAYIRTARRWRALIKALQSAPKWERRKRAMRRVRNRSPRSKRWRIGRLRLVGTRLCLHTNTFRPYNNNLALTLLRRHRFVKSGLWRGVRRRFAGFWRHRLPKRTVNVMRARWLGIVRLPTRTKIDSASVPPSVLAPYCEARRADWLGLVALNSQLVAGREVTLANRHLYRKLLMRWRLGGTIFVRRRLGIPERPIFKGKLTTRRRLSYSWQATTRFIRCAGRYTARRKYSKNGYFFQPRLARRSKSRRRFSLVRHVRSWFDPKGAGVYQRKRYVRAALRVRSSKQRRLQRRAPRRMKRRPGTRVKKRVNRPLTRKPYGHFKKRHARGNLWITWSRRRRPKLRFRKKNLIRRKLPPTGKFKNGRFVVVKKKRRGVRGYRARSQDNVLRGVNKPIKFKLRAFNILHKLHYVLRIAAHANHLLRQGERTHKTRRRLKRTMVPSWMWWFKRRKWHRYWKIALKKKYQKSRKISGKARFLLSGRWKPWRFYRTRRLHLSLRRNPASGFWWRAAKRWPGRRGMSAAVRRMWRMLQNRKTTKRTRRLVLLSWYFDEFNTTSRLLKEGRPVSTAWDLTERFEEWHASAQAGGFFKNAFFGKVQKPTSETRVVESVKPWGRACRFKWARATAL